MKCKHYNGDGFHYLNWELLLCDKCEQKLRKEMFKQIQLEIEVYDKVKEK